MKTRKVFVIIRIFTELIVEISEEKRLLPMYGMFGYMPVYDTYEEAWNMSLCGKYEIKEIEVQINNTYN